jgi:hypothetical protein
MTVLVGAGVAWATGTVIALVLLMRSGSRARAQERGVNEWARERGMEIPYPETEKEMQGESTATRGVHRTQRHR